MKFVSCLLFIFLLEMHNSKRISTPHRVKRIPLKKTAPKWHIVNSATTKSLHQVLPFTENRLTNIAVGIPQQYFTIQIDTGFNDFWVFSNEYFTSDPSYPTVAETHKLFNSTSSWTFRFLDEEPSPELFTAKEGWAFGYRANDFITVLGTKIDTIFYIVKLANIRVANIKFDGVMGLQYVPGTGNIITQLCRTKNKKSHFQFSIHYERVYDTEYDSGVLTICTKVENSTMNWIKEIEPGTWNIKIDNVRLQDSRGNFSLRSSFMASFDTALNEIRTPLADLERLHDILTPYLNGETGTYEFDCESVRIFPNFILTINGKEYTITGFDYTHEIEQDGAQICTLSIKNGTLDNQWNLGIPFLRKYFTAFDMDTHEVGLIEMSRKPLPLK